MNVDDDYGSSLCHCCNEVLDPLRPSISTNKDLGRKSNVAAFTMKSLLRTCNSIKKRPFLSLRSNPEKLKASHGRLHSKLAETTRNSSATLVGIEGPYASYPLLQSYKPAAVAGVVDGMPRYPSFSAGGMLRGFDYLGTIVFAISGSITAGNCGLDVFGASVIGTITAIGGGTVRDSIILHKQPFWVNEVEYFFMAFFAALFTFFAWPLIPNETKLIKDESGGEGCALWLGDSLGVGTFAIIGAMNACRMCVHPGLAVAAGVVTATFGGLTRDIICGLPSFRSRGRILHSESNIYAATAAIGASAYMITRKLAVNMPGRIFFGLASTMGARILAEKYDIGLPTWDKMNFATKVNNP